MRRPATVFQCRTTGHVWPRQVLGCAPETGCEGSLEAKTERELDDYPRFRRLRIGFNLVEASQQLGLRLAPGSRAQRVRAALQRV